MEKSEARRNGEEIDREWEHMQSNAKELERNRNALKVLVAHFAHI